MCITTSPLEFRDLLMGQCDPDDDGLPVYILLQTVSRSLMDSASFPRGIPTTRIRGLRQPTRAVPPEAICVYK